jgi:PKHD-type hydroxylase
MNGYLIQPGPPIFDQSYACWQGAFDKATVARIIEIGESMPKQQATVFGEDGSNLEVLTKLRRTEVSWIDHDERSDWLYKSLGRFAADLNAKFFGFELFGFVDSLQYTVYHGSPETPGHYDWHMDMGLKTDAPRKLSIVVPLSDPSEFTGGELEFLGISTKSIGKKPGSVHAFPAWGLHRVTPVTSGTRRSLVGWIAGPQFR